MRNKRLFAWRQSRLYTDQPELVRNITNLKDNDKIEVEFATNREAKNFRQRVYMFDILYGDKKKPSLKILLRENRIYISKRIRKRIRIKIHHETENQFLRQKAD